MNPTVLLDGKLVRGSEEQNRVISWWLREFGGVGVDELNGSQSIGMEGSAVIINIIQAGFHDFVL